jgi:hypothetical protein
MWFLAVVWLLNGGGKCFAKEQAEQQSLRVVETLNDGNRGQNKTNSG